MRNKMKKKMELIGIEGTLVRRLKESVRAKLPKDWKDDAVIGINIYIKGNKTIVKITNVNEIGGFTAWIWGDSTKKERKAESKRITKVLQKNRNKPVDTSKWVHPDKKSIEYALIKELVLLKITDHNKTDNDSTIYDIDYAFYLGHKVKAETLYSVLYSHRPTNPQTLTNFTFDECFTIAKLLNDEEQIKKLNQYTKDRKDMSDMRKLYQESRAKYISSWIRIKK